MKGRKARKASNAFLRGFVATALLVAVQGRRDGRTPSGAKVLRRAVQGATALTAGTIAATALQDRNYGRALTAVAAGAAGVLAAEYLPVSTGPHEEKENDLGQEEA